MASPTGQRRASDAAVDMYRSGDTAAALAVFTRITTSPGMSDAWLSRMACGDHDLAHWPLQRNSRAVPGDPPSRPRGDGAVDSRARRRAVHSTGGPEFCSHKLFRRPALI
jgi:hypothetical protein